MYDLYCLGGAAVDLILEVSRLPQPKEKYFVKNSTQVCGGFIANTACGAARLGLQTAWSGYIGNDAFGQIIQDDFQKFGVCISDVEIQDEGSDYAVVMITPNGDRTILLVPKLPTPPPLTEKVGKSLKETKIAYTTIYEPNWFEEVAGLVHSGNGKMSIDLEANTIKDTETAAAMLASADIVFTDEAGVAAFTGDDIGRDSVDRILTLGPEIVIVTKGGDGAMAFTSEGFYSSGIHKVRVKDTTGAGDCFHAAFLYGLLSNRKIKDCLDFAGASAAILIQKIGARNGLPTSREVEDFIKNN